MLIRLVQLGISQSDILVAVEQVISYNIQFLPLFVCHIACLGYYVLDVDHLLVRVGQLFIAILHQLPLHFVVEIAHLQLQLRVGLDALGSGCGLFLVLV